MKTILRKEKILVKKEIENKTFWKRKSENKFGKTLSWLQNCFQMLQPKCVSSPLLKLSLCGDCIHAFVINMWEIYHFWLTESRSKSERFTACITESHLQHISVVWHRGSKRYCQSKKVGGEKLMKAEMHIRPKINPLFLGFVWGQGWIWSWSKSILSWILGGNWEERRVHMWLGWGQYNLPPPSFRCPW